MAAPVAIGFFYLAIREYYDKCSHPDQELTTISNEVVMGIFAGVMMVAIMAGSLANTPLDRALEAPFLTLLILPLFGITYLLMQTLRKIKKSEVAFYFPALGISISALGIDIWIGRISDLYQLATVYVISYSLQNVFHASTATIMIFFVMAILKGIREDTLYKCEVTEKSELRTLKPGGRYFRLDEQ